MDIIERFILYIFTKIGFENKKATQWTVDIMHAVLIYFLLVGSGIALFIPHSSLLPSVIPIATVILLALLLGLAEWSERKIVRRAPSEEWISILVSFISFYLTAVGVFVSILAEIGIIDQLSRSKLYAFIFIIAFLVYSLSDLTQLFEKQDSELNCSFGNVKGD